MPPKKRLKRPSAVQGRRLPTPARARRRKDRGVTSGATREMPPHPILRGRAGELIHYSSRLLFVVRFLLEQAGAEEAVRAVNRALNAATFARADLLQSTSPAPSESIVRQTRGR
jgi:hypothetical protein